MKASFDNVTKSIKWSKKTFFDKCVEKIYLHTQRKIK